MEKKVNTIGKDSYKLLFILIIGVIVLWIASWVAIQCFYGDKTTDNKGTFGDMFGAVNALFSGLAFAGLIFTIYIQRKELRLQVKVLEAQVEELGLQRMETKRSADQLEAQRKLMNLQRVETTTMQLLKFLDDFSGNLKFLDEKGHEYARGKGGFDTLCENHKNLEKTGNYSSQDAFEILSIGNKSNMDRYYRTIYYILQFVNNSDIDESNEQVFADLLSLQLNDSEIKCLYLYSNENQHELLLLKKYKFFDRYESISVSKTI